MDSQRISYDGMNLLLHDHVYLNVGHAVNPGRRRTLIARPGDKTRDDLPNFNSLHFNLILNLNLQTQSSEVWDMLKMSYQYHWSSLGGHLRIFHQE